MPSIFNGGVCFFAGWIGPVRVGVVVIKVVGHRVNDLTRNLRPTGPVEVGDRMPIVIALESREVRTDFRGQSTLDGWQTPDICTRSQ